MLDIAGLHTGASWLVVELCGSRYQLWNDKSWVIYNSDQFCQSRGDVAVGTNPITSTHVQENPHSQAQQPSSPAKTTGYYASPTIAN